MVTTARSVAPPALRSTVALRKSTKRTRGSDEQRPEEVAHAVRAVDHDVGLLLEPRRPLVGGDADAQRVAEPAGGSRAPCAPSGSCSPRPLRGARPPRWPPGRPPRPARRASAAPRSPP